MPGREVTSGIRPTRAEIDLSAIVANASTLKRLVGDDVAILGVVKADAYGHGAVPVARALARCDAVAGLAVSLAEEGLELRRAGVGGTILVMGGVYRGAHRDLAVHDLTPVISDPEDAAAFSRAALSIGRRIGVHVKLDTGMSRLGVRPEGLAAFLDRFNHLQGVAITGVCTHLASADAPSDGQTREQLRLFDLAIPVVRAAAGGPLVVHAANSAAVLRHPEARYDAVRPGLALYGGQSLAPLLAAAGTASGDPGIALEPAMRFASAIAQLRDLEAGDAASYGALWRAPRRARVATLPVGYADGYPRRLTGSGEVLIRGRRCPVVGAVCMDMTLVDVTELGGQVDVGDEAVLLGDQGDERITAAELADRAGLIEYEITCGISKRVPRVYAGPT